MPKTSVLFAAALMAGLVSQSASAACYVVYGPAQQVLYRATQPPVDLSRPLHETVPAVVPGGTLVFALDNYGCEFEINRLSQYAAPAQPARPAQARRAPRG